jgi:hypothetical protein
MIINACFAQDLVYKKEGAAFYCKIREITVDVIKYKRTDIKNSPIFEIKKADVYKIRYNKGIVDIVDPEFYKKKTGDIYYSMVYIVYDSNLTSQVFPLYVNGKFVCKLKSHSRLALKLESEVEYRIKRETNVEVGPKVSLVPIFGLHYAIAIKVINEHAAYATDMYSMTVITIPEEVQRFIDTEYNGFTPDNAHDFHADFK